MNDKTLREAIGTLLASQSFAVLATAGPGGPYTSLVGFTPGEDLKEIFFATLVNTRKFANLSRRPEVSLMVDSRANRPEDLLRARALTVTGRAAVVSRKRAAAARSAYLARFPHLKDFTADPQCALVSVRVSRYILVERFQEVWQLRIDEKADNPTL